MMETQTRADPRKNEQIMLMCDKMIPSSVNITNKALHPYMVFKHKKENTALLTEVSVPNDFRLNATEIRKTTKYQDLKNEVKRMWKLKKSEVGPVIAGAAGILKKNPYCAVKNHSWEYHHKRATSGGCQRFSEDSEKIP